MELEVDKLDIWIRQVTIEQKPIRIEDKVYISSFLTIFFSNIIGSQTSFCNV